MRSSPVACLIFAVTLPAIGQQPQLPTIRTGTQLVIVDIVVSDKNHNPVHDLKPEDFTLIEGNTPQTIKNFDEHRVLSNSAAPSAAQPPKLPPGTFTNFSPLPQTGPLNILLIDRLNTPLEDQAAMFRQINQYLAAAQPGMRMAIFGLSSKLVLLQGFTTDPNYLRSAVDKRGNLRASPLLDAPVGGAAPVSLTDTMLESLNGLVMPPLTLIERMKDLETEQASQQLQTRVQYTLNAMNELARYLAAFPGRKNLIWFSGSFPVNIMPSMDPSVISSDATLGGGASLNQIFGGVASMEKDYFQTAALLSHSQVAVYPIDAKGLFTNTMYHADGEDSIAIQGRSGTLRAANQTNDITNFENTKFSDGSTMYSMAADTGGRATLDTNNLADALAKAVEDGSNYYSIAYSPANTNWNGGYRSIQVRLKQQGYTLNYRKGYFADPEIFAAAHAATVSSGPAVSHAMLLALTHGGPVSTQITFTARVLPVSTAVEDSVAPRNKPGKGSHGPYRRYRVDFSIDPRTLTFTQTPEGNRHETLEFVAHLYDTDGNLANSAGAGIQASIIPAAYQQFQITGIPYHLEVSVPAKGDYFLRVAVHDVEQDHVGALELPIAAVQALPPPTPAP